MNVRSVAIVAVTFDSEALLGDFVTSLSEGADGIQWELIVVDNDSRDGTVLRLREIAPDATVIEMGRNAGYAAGINVGVQAARAHDAILIVNPDVRLLPGCLPRLATVLATEKIGIAVPNLVDASGKLILSMRREPSLLRAFGDALLGAERAGRWAHLGEVVSDPREYRKTAVVDWAEGSTQLVSASCWRACGPWDESFFLYSEEAEYNLRARDLGFATVYEPSARAIHLEGESAGSPGLWALLQLNRVRLFHRRNNKVATAAFWLATVLREASRSLVGSQPSKAALTALLSPRRWRERPGPASVR